jgi:hypothetical protein
MLPRETKITPGSNLMWESSRMMLPEHAEALLKQARKRSKKEKPELDEQHLEELDRRIVQAYRSQKRVTVKVFGEWEVRNLTGQIIRIDPYKRQIRLKAGEAYFWLKWDDLLEVD